MRYAFTAGCFIGSALVNTAFLSMWLTTKNNPVYAVMDIILIPVFCVGAALSIHAGMESFRRT